MSPEAPTAPSDVLAPVPTLGLAPMEGVTGFAMRLWMAMVGAPPRMTTPFLRLTATHPAATLPVDFAPEVFEAPGSRPPSSYELTPQVMAVEADHVIRTWPLLEGAPVVELNCGCPSPLCSGKGAGSGLLKDPDVFAETVDRLVRAVGPGRLAVKMRTGFADASEFEALLQGVGDQPLARLTVHGRTRAQGYGGRARWDLIARAAAVARAPVVASGDVVDGPSLAALLGAAPGVASVIIGRGALRNPWLFRELQAGAPVELTIDTVIEALAVHAQLHDLSSSRPEVLRRLALDGLFAREASGTQLDAWAAMRAALAEAAAVPEDGGGPLTSRSTVGRVKLLWSHLRTSLSAAGRGRVFFEPQLLRSKSLAELFGAIRAVAAANGVGRAEALTLVHDESHDRLFGRGKDPEAPAAPL
jgi:tRNA-dihydrouridine synthase